jgi:glutathione S-transferase
MKYELYYWPGIQGRGEYVRLALEDAGADYVDYALVPEKKGGGVPALQRWLEGFDVARPPYAPPFLKAGRRIIGQTANILLFLGPKLGLAPRDASGRLWTNELQLTIADFVAETHETHHPVASALYYEQQKREAKRRTRDFIEARMPKYLGYFERVLQRNTRGSGLVDARITYADLSLAQVIAGLRYAFPKASKAALADYPRLVALHDEVFARPRLKRYLRSKRRLNFNRQDIFRHYPELDVPAT